jgi:hypothetical protein
MKFELKAILKFIIVLTILLTGYSLFESYIISFLNTVWQYWFDFFINSQQESLKRLVEVNYTEGESLLNFNIIFVNRLDPNSSQIKTVSINIFNEMIICFSLTTALVSTFRMNKNRLIKYLISSSIMVLMYILIKFLILIYDNYSYPEFSLIELTGFKSIIVFYGSIFLEKTGYSSNLIIPIFIWIIFAVKSDEFR